MHHDLTDSLNYVYQLFNNENFFIFQDKSKTKEK